MRPRWDSPRAWLEDASKRWSKEKLREELLTAIGLCDAETLEDEYVLEMGADGYHNLLFEPIELTLGLRVKIRRGCDLISEGRVGVIDRIDYTKTLSYTVRFDSGVTEVFSELELTRP